MTSKIYHIKARAITAFLTGVVICLATTVKAQVNPLASQYFQNQYLFNPAMAGLTKGLDINLAYSKQGLGVDGSQNTQAITGEYSAGKAAYGISAFNNYSGLFRTTRAVATFAYHIPLGGDDQKLNFGISAGLVNQHVQQGDIIGTVADPTVSNFNNNPNYFDGDFGVSYTSNHLTLQAAVPDIKSLTSANSTAEREVFFTSASYKLGDPADISVEPKVVFRQVRGFDKIVDAGANLTFDQNAFSLQAMYHSSNSATFGFGFNKPSYAILAFYTTNTSSLNAYNNGDVEISLRFNLLRGK